MKLLIISDLHIGIKSQDDIFQWDDQIFIEKMKKTISEYEIDSVILNGDIYELYKYTYSAICEVHPDLIQFLNHFYYIRGNHDMVMDKGETYLDIENNQGQLIHIEHGHNSDWLNGNRLGRFVATCLFGILKLGFVFSCIRKLYFKFIEWDDDHVKRKYDRLKYLNYALGLLKKYDIVILGHTHKLEKISTYFHEEKKRYFNCGTCSKKKFQGIVLDTETLNYEMIKEKSNEN